MRKIFFFALASLALASCSQDEEFVAEKSNGGSERANSNVLGFSTYTAGGTRAGVVTSAEVKTSGFKVAAWYDGKLYFNPDEKASYAEDISGKKIFDTDGEIYYWPSFSAGKIGFRAFNIIGNAAWKTNKEYYDVDFTIKNKASEQSDLVIAYSEATSKPTDGIQPLNFTHTLSKVNFSLKGAKDGNKYTVNKIEVIAANATTVSFVDTKVTDLASGGADTDQPDAAKGTQADKCSWNLAAIDGAKALVKKDASAAANDANNAVLFQYYTSADSTTTAGTVISGTTAQNLDANLMIAPQSGKIAVRVYYKVETPKKVQPAAATETAYNLIGNCGYYETDPKGHHNNGDANYSSTGAIFGCKTAVITLDGTEAPKFEAGKSYRFTLTLPDDNFMGDGAAGNTADGVADMGVDGLVDLDADGDVDKSEFDQLTPIRFSVTVSDWVAEGAATEVTVK